MKKVKNKNSFHISHLASSKKGFTLLELLVVIAIIGVIASIILVGLGGLREASRDDRRVADLRQVQQALQLFHLKCGFYPGEYDINTNECKKNNPSTWADLATNLKNAEIGIESIPNDPIPGKNYQYWVNLLVSNKIAPSQCYVLLAAMETDHKALKDPKELDGVPPVSNLYPANPAANCSGSAYCVGNIECKEYFK